MSIINTYPIVESTELLDPNGDDLDIVDALGDEGIDNIIDDAAEEMEEAEADLISGFSDFESEGLLVPDNISIDIREDDD